MKSVTRTTPVVVLKVVSRTLVSSMYRRVLVYRRSGEIANTPPLSRSSNAANTDGAEKCGRQSHSIAPSRDTNATVRPSPIAA